MIKKLDIEQAPELDMIKKDLSWTAQDINTFAKKDVNNKLLSLSEKTNQEGNEDIDALWPDDGKIQALLVKLDAQKKLTDLVKELWSYDLAPDRYMENYKTYMDDLTDHLLDEIWTTGDITLMNNYPISNEGIEKSKAKLTEQIFKYETNGMHPVQTKIVWYMLRPVFQYFGNSREIREKLMWYRETYVKALERAWSMKNATKRDKAKEDAKTLFTSQKETLFEMYEIDMPNFIVANPLTKNDFRDNTLIDKFSRDWKRRKIIPHNMNERVKHLLDIERSRKDYSITLSSLISDDALQNVMMNMTSAYIVDANLYWSQKLSTFRESQVSAVSNLTDVVWYNSNARIHWASSSMDSIVKLGKIFWIDDI